MKSINNYCAAAAQTPMESNSLVWYHSKVFMPKIYLHIMPVVFSFCYCQKTLAEESRHNVLLKEESRMKMIPKLRGEGLMGKEKGTKGQLVPQPSIFRFICLTFS